MRIRISWCSTKRQHKKKTSVKLYQTISFWLYSLDLERNGLKYDFDAKKKIGQNWIMYKKIIWKIFIKSINIISFFVNLNTLIYVNTRYAYKITGIFLFNWMVSVSFFKRWGGFIRFSYIYVLSSLIVCVFQKEKTSVGINKYSRMSIVYVCLFSQLFAAI